MPSAEEITAELMRKYGCGAEFSDEEGGVLGDWQPGLLAVDLGDMGETPGS